MILGDMRRRLSAFSLYVPGSLTRLSEYGTLTLKCTLTNESGRRNMIFELWEKARR